MDEILKSGCASSIKNSSFKNYKSISIKLFNIINKKDYHDDMSNEDIMVGFGKVVNKFDKLKEYLDNDKNGFKISTKKNYINNLLNIILRIKDIEKYCIKKKSKLETLKLDIKNYWCFLRLLLKEKEMKKQKENEEEEEEEEEEEQEEQEEEEEKEEQEEEEEEEDPKQLEPIITDLTPIVELTSLEQVDDLVLKYVSQGNVNSKIFKINCEISTLELEDKLLNQEIEHISKKQKLIQKRITELKKDKKEHKEDLNKLLYL